MQSDLVINFAAFIRRPSALLMAAVCGGWISTANAALNCSVMVSPADGIIPAGTMLATNQANTCFDNATIAIVNNGTIANQPSGGLTSVGSLTNSAGASLHNYGTFRNYTGASLTSKGVVRNYQGATFLNMGNYYADSSSNRNDGLWINDAEGLVEVSTTFDNRNGANFTNNGIAKISDFYNWAGASFENNGYITDGPIPSGYLNSSIGNAGTLTNNASGQIVIKLLTNDNVMTNHGRIEMHESALLRNGKTFNNKSGGETHNRGTFRNQPNGVVTNEGWISNFGTLQNFGKIDNKAGASLTSAERIENKAGAVLTNSGQLVNSDTILNEGTIEIKTGSTMGGNGKVVQSAGVITIDGSAEQSHFDIMGGEIRGSGSARGGISVAQNGRMAVDGLTLNGNLTVFGGTIYNTVSATDFTKMSVTGTGAVYLLSTPTFEFDFGGFIPDVGDSWLFLEGDVFGNLRNFILDVHHQGDIAFRLDIVEEGVRLSAIEAVPVPGAAWLFGSALLGLFGVRRIRA